MARLTVEKRYRLQTRETERCVVILAGCGGTGSFLALHLARLAYHLHETRGLRLPLVFVDPDAVEPKNLGRQNFAPAEVGRNKAQALAWRYNLAFGLDIAAQPERFDPAAVYAGARYGVDYGHWALLIGAVDNVAGRRSLAECARQRDETLWLDCGNHEHAGQVVLGNREKLKAPEISPLGFCAGLPLPSVQHPELVADPEPETALAESCAELTLREVQGLMVNQAIATYAVQYVYRLLVTRDLDVYQTYVDLATGSARSTGITGKLVTGNISSGRRRRGN